MRSPRSFAAPSAFLLALAAPLFVSGRASAQEACGEHVCPKGYTCETVSLRCPAIDCEGPDCPSCEGTEEYCAPAPCTSDADCADGMVCHTETRQECDAPAPCDRGDGDGREIDCESTPTNCSPVSVSACVPRWTLPCTTAADCGAGFECVEQLQGGCPSSPGSAGGGSQGSQGEADPARPLPGEDANSADGGAPPGDVPAADGGGDDGCVFEPSGEFACVLIETACDTNSDCLPGWTCAQNRRGSCWASSDGSMGCDPVDPPNLCYPPYAGLGYAGVAEDGGGTLNREPSGAPSGGDEPGPSVPGRGNAAESGDDDAAAKPKSGGGCTVSGTGAGSGAFGALALAFLGLFVARRRR